MSTALLISIMVVSSSSNQSSLPEIQVVLRRLQDEEQLYENLDVNFIHKVIPLRETPLGPPDRAPKEVKTSFHSVRQGGKVRLIVDRSGKYIDGKAFSSKQDMGYDGSYSRIKMGGVFNKHEGKKDFEGIFLPHSQSMRGLFSPLHIWLGGGELMRSHPGSHFGWTQADVITSVVAREEIDKIICLKLHCDCFYLDPKTGKSPLGKFDLWIAEKYNLLPMRWQYVHMQTPNVPFISGRSFDLFECSPGIWLPRRMEHMINDRFASKPNAIVPDHKEVYEVISCDPDPKYPASFFSDIQPDANMATYEVANGKITSSSIGHQYLHVLREESKRRPYLLWGLTLSILLASFGIFLYIKRRRQRRRYEIV